MNVGSDYLPCPDCSAVNITCRQVCWKCGNVLPYTVMANGQARVHASADQPEVSEDEISRLLDQAVTLVRSRGTSDSAGPRFRLPGWPRSRKNEASGTPSAAR